LALVLVVDDEPDIRLLARVVLTGAGHDVVEAVNGPAGLDRIGAAPRPDVVVLDVRMPGLDGWGVLAQLPDGSPPVVLVSADPEANRRSHRWVLSKPYRPAELVAAVEAALEEATA
jgi:two-component system response regulator AdeR